MSKGLFIEEYKKKFLETINDDLNIPLAMSIIWEIIKSEKKSKQYAELLLDFDRVLGLDLKNSKKYLESKEKIIEHLKKYELELVDFKGLEVNDYGGAIIY